MPEPRSTKKREEDEEATPLLEWLFGAIGLLLFVGALAVTLLNGFSPDKPPAITVKVELPQETDGRFRVEFEAINTGDETASLVQIVATLRDGGSVVETHSVEIDFLPPHSTRRAGVFFARNPDGLALDIQPVSYQHP